jgi:DNA-binding PadR family transcriptional regulator
VSADKFATDIVRSSIIMLLYEKPLHGYGLILSLRERLGKDISPSLIYPFLSQMEKRGLVSATNKPVGRKPRKIYTLTDEGKLLALRVFKRLSSLISIAIEPTLSICAHCGAKLYEVGHSEVVNGKELAFCCSFCCQAYKNEKAVMTIS